MTNPYESAARAKKVMRLIEILKRANITAEEASNATDEDWKLATDACRINPASPETRRQVIASLRAMEAKPKGMGAS